MQVAATPRNVADPASAWHELQPHRIREFDQRPRRRPLLCHHDRSPQTAVTIAHNALGRWPRARASSASLRAAQAQPARAFLEGSCGASAMPMRQTDVSQGGRSSFRSGHRPRGPLRPWHVVRAAKTKRTLRRNGLNASVVRAPIELKGSARQRHVGHVAALISHALALSVRCGAQGRMRRANDVRHRASWVRTPDSVQTRTHGTSGGRSCSPSLGPATEKIRAEMSRPCFTSLARPFPGLVSLEALPSTGRDG